MTTTDLLLAIEALGLGKECIKINKHVNALNNIMRDTFLRKVLHNVELTGSYHEGLFPVLETTGTRDADIVINYVNDDVTILPWPGFPGYVFLIQQKPTFKIFSNDIIKLFKYTGNSQLKIIEETQNGPAYTLQIDDFGCSGISKSDSVHVITFPTWPNEACKWVNRNKPRNWPSKELMEEIKSKGFTLAPVGHKKCKFEKLQWRIGIKGEKVLFSDLNETQILCYISLKLILQDDLQRINQDALSSYHMKNVVFWCAEQESCQWTKENFEICLKSCINKLINFIECGNFPHYFIEDRNLIYSEMTLEVKEQILKVLTKYSSDILAMLSLQSFKVLDEYTSLELELCVKQESIIFACLRYYVVSFTPLFEEHHLLWGAYEGHNTAINLKTAQAILSHLENRKRHFIRPYIACAKNMLGLLHYSRYMATRCQSDNLKAGELLRRSVTFEHVSVKFRLATFYFMENALDDCLDICNSFTNKSRKYITLKEKIHHTTSVFKDIMTVVYKSGRDSTSQTELKQKILEIFYAKDISDKSTDERLEQVQKHFNILTGNSLDDMLEREKSYVLCGTSLHDILLLVIDNFANLVFCDMSFNVPYLASEKFAVPEVIQYELLSVFSCYLESAVYGIYIDAVLNCLVLTFLCYQKTKNWTQRNVVLTQMFNYSSEYSKLVESEQTVPTELPHSLQLYRVYNIVAYCCIEARRYNEASDYVQKSFLLYRSAKNTAYAYIRCGVLKGIQGKYPGTDTCIKLIQVIA